MKIHQAKTKFKTENGKVHILLNIFLTIHFRFYVFPAPGFSFFDAVNKLPVSPQISRFFYLDLQVFGLLGLRGLQEGLLLVKSTLSEHPILY